MVYQDKSLCRVRTITSFLTLSADRKQWPTLIHQASVFCAGLAARLQQQGYDVQSLRIVTNPFGEYLNLSSPATAKADLAYLTELLERSAQSDLRLRFAIGEARNADELALLPELIRDYGDLCNACINISRDDNGILDDALIQQAAQVVKTISQITPRGEGNFNFTVNFNCQPLIPYFPASYYRSSAQDPFVIGLESPDLLLAVLNQFNNDHPGLNHNEKYAGYLTAMHQALQHHIDAIAAVAKEYSGNQGFHFAGIDSSAAPSKDCSSMTALYRAMGVEHFGAAGTVEASSLLTKVFKSIQGVELVGFSGLMLALTEDQGLAEGSVRAEFDIRALLTYSAVCGIGLDTVPIPGDCPPEKIAALMRDTGTLAYRLNKPLTVRLFPAPGLQAGEITRFESDDLCNCAVLAVP